MLLRKGLAAWLEAWSRVPAPAVPAAPADGPGPLLPAGVSAEVTRVLAGMALAHLREVRS